jgi:hypothetical protein
MVVMLVSDAMLADDALDIHSPTADYAIAINNRPCDFGRLERWIDAMLAEAQARGRRDERTAIKQLILASVARLLDEILPESETS